MEADLPLAASYRDALALLSAELGLKNDVTGGWWRAFRMCLRCGTPQWTRNSCGRMSAVSAAAVENFVQMRAAEGEKLKEDILGRLSTIEQAVGTVEEGSAGRVEAYTKKLYARLQTLLQDQNIDEARLLTEAAIFCRQDRRGRGDRAAAQPHCPVPGDSGQRRPGGPQLTFDPGAQPGDQYHWFQVPDLAITRVVVNIKAEIEKIGNRFKTSNNDRRGNMKLINIGFGNMVSAGRLIAIVSPESAPIKRIVRGGPRAR